MNWQVVLNKIGSKHRGNWNYELQKPSIALILETPIFIVR